MSDSLFGQEFRNFYFCIGDGKPVQEIGVHKRSRFHIGKYRFIYIHRTSGNHLDNGHVKLLCEFPVTLIMSRHRHDGACSITHEHIIGNPDWDFLSINRIDGRKPPEHDAGFLFGKLGALKIRLPCRQFSVGGNLVPVFNILFVFVDKRMLRAHDHISNAKQGVRSCGVDPHLILFVL